MVGKHIKSIIPYTRSRPTGKSLYEADVAPPAFFGHPKVSQAGVYSGGENAV